MKISRQRAFDKYLGYLLIALLLPLTRLLGILLRRNHSLKQKPDTILFIKLLGLGSLILASDSIRQIRQNYPGVKFILLTDDTIAKGIIPFQLFDEIRTIRSESFWSVFSSSAYFLFECWKIKRLWVADLEVYSKLTTVYSLFTLGINRFGFYLSPVFFRKYLNTHNVFFNRSSFLEDNYFQLAECITGVKTSISPLVIARTDEKSKPYIALNNTCSDLALVRKLPVPVYIQLCQWILKNTSYNIVLLGAPKDHEETDRMIQNDPILQSFSDRVLNFAGSVDFPSYYKFLSEQCACLISIDSAPLHIARKLGLPTVSVWGPTDPGNYLKIEQGEENRHLFYYGKASCSPCIHYFEHLPCGGNNFCMKEVPLEAIFLKIQTLLNNLKS